MSRISRRRFLQFAGISFFATSLHDVPTLPELPHQAAIGRTFGALPVYDAPDHNARIITQLWPDGVVTLLDEMADWYRITEGFVRRDGVQPMTINLLQKELSLPELPFWAEVIAPTAPVRAWCAADAPAVTRIGHGGVARIIDALPRQRESGAWIGLESQDGALLGWSQAVYWQAVDVPPIRHASTRLEINQARFLLTAIENGETILTATFASGETIPPGVYTLTGRQMAVNDLKTADSEAQLTGVPWITTFGETWQIGGVYWHNRFGMAYPGPAVQVTPLLARWLYGWMGQSGQVRVT